MPSPRLDEAGFTAKRSGHVTLPRHDLQEPRAKQRMRHIWRRLALVPLLFVLSACGALGVFNALVPKDHGVARPSRDVSYGPDPRQRLDVYMPADGRHDHKVLVFLYGGSWTGGRRQDYEFVGRAFAARGFVTVVPDYRLVPAIRYPAFVQDSAKAVAWAYRHAGDYGGDPEKFYLVGHSAGAYNAMMVALAPEFLRAEGMRPDMIRAAAGLSGPYDFLPLDRMETREAFAGTGDLPTTQPINRPRRDRAAPPIILLHGTADDFVLPRNSEALAAALRRAGHIAELRLYPGVGHRGTLFALSLPFRQNAPALDDVAEFFERQSGPRLSRH